MRVFTRLVLYIAGCAMAFVSGCAMAPVADPEPETFTRDEVVLIFKRAFEAGYYQGWKRAMLENGHGL
jgi:hypothetical protein